MSVLVVDVVHFFFWHIARISLLAFFAPPKWTSVFVESLQSVCLVPSHYWLGVCVARVEHHFS